MKQTFGAKLPTPYIQQVKIYDASYVVTLALYFEIDFDLEPNDFFSRIAPSLGNVCIFNIIDGYIPSDYYGYLPYSGTIANERTNAAASVLSKKYSILEVWDRDELVKFIPGSDSGDDETAQIRVFGDSGWALSEIAVSDFTFSDFMESGTKKICKFVYEQELALYDDNASAYDTRNKIYFTTIEEYAMDFNLFCCLVPPDTIDFGLASYNDMFWAGESAAAGSRVTTGLFELAQCSTSDITHQTIFTTGSLAVSPVDIYTLADSSATAGSTWSGDAVQSISGDYYTDEKITLQEIVDSFGTTLISSSNEEIVNGVDGISYILSEYGNSSELLPRLYSFYKVAPYKGAASSVGSWFEGVSSQMFRSNELVLGASKLKKELAVTPVILDLRSIVLTAYDVPDATNYNQKTDFIYCGSQNALVARSGFFPEAQVSGEEQAFSSTEEFVTFTKGFIFFDYEKALRTQSQISQILDIDKLVSFFEDGFINQHFRLSAAKLDRQQSAEIDEDASDTQIKTTAYYDTSTETTWTYPKIDYITNLIPDVSSFYEHYVFTDFTQGETGPETYYPYLYLRNWNLVSENGLNDYRLMCFEFEHANLVTNGYYEDSTDSDSIYFSVDFLDTTAEIYDILEASFSHALTGALEPYLELAAEFCSYNNIEGTFNEFFAANIEEQYSDLSTAPWFLAPLVFNLHLDLLTNQWAGEKDNIVSEARLMSSRLNPRGGTLLELQAFYDLMISFYNSFYAPGAGSVAIVRESLSDNIELNFGSDSGDASNDGAILANLPDVDFLNVTVPITYEEVTWTWDYSLSMTYDYGKYWGSSDNNNFDDEARDAFNFNYEPVYVEQEITETKNTGFASTEEGTGEYEEVISHYEYNPPGFGKMLTDIEEWAEDNDGDVRKDELAYSDAKITYFAVNGAGTDAKQYTTESDVRAFIESEESYNKVYFKCSQYLASTGGETSKWDGTVKVVKWTGTKTVETITQ